MKGDFRYKMEHLGDSFATVMGKVIEAAKDSAHGVVLTYDIRRLKREKKRLTFDLGGRTYKLAKSNESVLGDDVVDSLVGGLTEVQAKLDALYTERRERLYPDRTKATTSGIQANARLTKGETTTEETVTDEQPHDVAGSDTAADTDTVLTGAADPDNLVAVEPAQAPQSTEESTEELLTNEDAAAESAISEDQSQASESGEIPEPHSESSDSESNATYKPQEYA